MSLKTAQKNMRTGIAGAHIVWRNILFYLAGEDYLGGEVVAVAV